MRISSATIANIALTGACVVFIAIGAKRLLDEPTESAAATARDPVTIVSDTQLSLKDAHVRGQQNARVVLIEFSDFECPFCASFAMDIYESVKKEFIDSGRVKHAFIQFPLPNHNFAQKASEAAECAGAQGKFWEMHDQLFANQRALALESLPGYAKTVGLDSHQFESCLVGVAAAKVRNDLAIGRRLGIRSTPTFFIAEVLADGSTVQVRKRIDGAHSVDVFRSAFQGL